MVRPTTCPQGWLTLVAGTSPGGDVVVVVVDRGIRVGGGVVVATAGRGSSGAVVAAGGFTPGCEATVQAVATSANRTTSTGERGRIGGL
jgi:hypothetical protein